VFTAPAVARYLAGAGQPDPQQARSALLILERAGLVTVDATAVWMSRALQAAVRSVAPPDLLDQAARAAADALAEVWPADQPRSWLAAALRTSAASLRQAARDSQSSSADALMTTNHPASLIGLERRVPGM